MILIAHRGNTHGPRPELENTIDYIESAIFSEYEVEIDLWGVGKNLYLGHDSPETPISNNWLAEYVGSLWVHCKNADALALMINSPYNYFFHHADAYTITSKGFVWAYPGSPPAGKSTIAVMPESFSGKKQTNLYQYAGVCSDFVGLMESLDHGL